MSYVCDSCGKNMGGQPDYQEFDRDPARVKQIRHECQECRVTERSCAHCGELVHHLTIPHAEDYYDNLTGRMSSRDVPEGDHNTYLEVATDTGRLTYHAQCLSAAATGGSKK